ncbi:strawberry notch-like NTP hydrolase domain-containing protein [Novosphingobium chloroacetimidivorans]|uniref:strawberry notch-like NTP hydrolase domain-containing protein n=1 Tax=Novosphingobium chloroacetimidivorans TaxID=1428314 RepID=UPI0016150641
MSPPCVFADIASRHALLQTLPTQTVRSEEQIAWQQFSTPMDLAALAVIVAQATPDDIVLEPSAGNGLLIAQLAPVATLQLNELDERRRRHLARSFPSAKISGHDGAAIGSVMAHLPRPTLILMNPPFSRSLGRGADQNAAARHLQAALRRVAPGGRVVAIMPDWFTNSARMKTVYETVLRDTTVQTSLRVERCYEKHGTSIAVRLYVIDKKPGHIAPTVIQRTGVLDLLDAISLVPRTKAASTSGMPAPIKRSSSLFKAVRSTGQAAPTIVRNPVINQVLPVAYAPLEQPRPLGEQVGVYLPYRPSRLDFSAAGEHPTALVESVAMGSIAAPRPDYVPHLPERIVTERTLSEPQLETLVYAGTAWSQWLPGKFVPAKEGVGLTLSDEGREYRKGYFLGDGTGAGKGRQIAACILDNWLQGRRRAIWVSKNEQLLEDARRDWSALGGLSADVQPLSNWKIDEALTLAEGILFVTYPTLRSQRQDSSRLKQITDWAGPNYEGVIAYDEAHEMGGVAGGEGAMGVKAGSQQGICGVLLQNNLPAARVLYASATGASEVNNLAYAVRLGLWGPGTAFANREQFITQIRSGGVAAMELVARDLKATGLYAARALSFAGVEYDILKHDLTPDQIEIYDAYADAWMVIHQHVERALELTDVVDGLEGKTLNGGAKAAARSRFESCKQRFFGQVLLSMKIPTLIHAIDGHLANGKSIVIQLVTTAESILDRRLGQLSPEERANLDIDLSPREYVIDYLERAFPTQQMQVFTDDNGNPRSAPMYDEAGHPVHNPEAMAAKAELIERLCVMPPIRPALDAVIEHFGTDAVAEVTGRTKRLVNAPDGSQKLESRSTRTSQADAAAFMAGTKRILVFSDAGGTGRSYHASLEVANQQQRVHFLLEPGWRADRAIQGLGRTHRTHQASTPLFTPLTTNSRGELRFTSTIARRLDTLGALTRGQRQTGGQNLFDPADNLESEYAKAALVTWFHLLVAGKLTSTNLGDFEDRTGLELTGSDGIIVDELPPIQRFLNRLLALPIALQNAIFDEFLDLIEARVAAAREAGTLDAGVETITVEKARVIDDTVLRTDPHTGATSHLVTLEVEKRLKSVTLDRIMSIAQFDDSSAFVRNTKSGRVALRLWTRSMMLETGEVLRRFSLMRPVRTETWLAAELKESAWELTDEDTFRRLWDDEAQDAGSRLETSTIRVATGLLLPIWSALPKDHLAVNRIVDEAGQSWLGRLVFEEHVPALLKTFGVDAATKLSPDEMVQSVLKGGTVEIATPWPITIRSSIVNRQTRTEIIGAPADQLAWFKSLGCFTEIIAYKTRLFVPVDRADSIITQLTAGACAA